MRFALLSALFTFSFRFLFISPKFFTKYFRFFALFYIGISNENNDGQN